MFTKLEAEKNTSSNYLMNTREVSYDEFVERLEELVKDQQMEVEHFSRMREKAEQDGMTLAATHYAKRYTEIYERTMSNIDTLELAVGMRDSVIFMITGAIPSFVYVGKKKKEEHELAKKDLKMIYG
jgi:hypothetical protein